MKLGVFVYNFPHQKSVEGLYWLAQWGYDCVVFAQDKKKLNIHDSPTRVTPRGLDYPHPANMARLFSYDYHITDHDTETVYTIARRQHITKAVILGARILKAPTIEAFPDGIINMHPGLLPHNRGLDNLKWAVRLGIPQGVTAHFIDPRIDWGTKLFTEIVPVYSDDTPLDVFLRTLNSELVNLRRAIESEPQETLPPGEYRTAMSAEDDLLFRLEWDNYRMNYEKIVGDFQASLQGHGQELPA